MCQERLFDSKVLRPIARILHVLEGKEDLDFNPEKYNGGRGFDFSGQVTLLSISLQAAVPLWVQQLHQRQRDYPDLFWDECQKTAKSCADIVAEKGDLLMFRGNKPGQTAQVFNALAQGLAIMAFCPGGVTVFGTHWEIKDVKVKV